MKPWRVSFVGLNRWRVVRYRRTTVPGHGRSAFPRIEYLPGPTKFFPSAAAAIAAIASAEGRV